MKKKGFTLIELIATILLVSVVAIIAKPLITGVIENIKKEAFRREVENGINNFITIEHNKLILGEKISKLDATDKSLSHNKFTGGTFRYKNNKYIALNVTNGEYCANGDITELVITEGICANTDTEYTFTTYDLSIDPNGGIYKNKSTVTKDEFETFPQNVSIDNPIRNGYEFKGWNTFINLNEGSGLLSTLLTANWQATSVNIIINPDGGIYEESTSTKIINANVGDFYELTSPTKEGYIFDKWIVVSGKESEIIGNQLKVGTEEVL